MAIEPLKECKSWSTVAKKINEIVEVVNAIPIITKISKDDLSTVRES